MEKKRTLKEILDEAEDIRRKQILNEYSLMPDIKTRLLKSLKNKKVDGRTLHGSVSSIIKSTRDAIEREQFSIFDIGESDFDELGSRDDTVVLVDLVNSDGSFVDNCFLKIFVDKAEDGRLKARAEIG